MKQTIGLVLVGIVCVLLIGRAFTLTSQYRKEATVIQVNACSITFEDADGNLWGISYEPNYKVGDKVLITIETQGTWDTKEDDEIISVDKI